MSQENVEIIRSIDEAFNRGDWDAAFRDTRPNVELTTPPASLRFFSKPDGAFEAAGLRE